MTYDDSYDYFHLLRNDHVIQKQLRYNYVKVWMTHMSQKIEWEKNEWPMMTHTSIFTYDIMITDWLYALKPTGTNKYSRYGGNQY